MDFWQHLNVQKQVEIEGLTEGLVARFSELMTRGHSVADLVSHYADDFGHLPVDRLRKMASAHRTWKIWCYRRDQHQQALSTAKLPMLPKEVLFRAYTPAQLDAVIRAARLCPLSKVEDEKQWIDVLSTGIEAWDRCLGLVRKQGQIHCDVKELSNPDSSRYDQYVRAKENINEIAPHRWLAMRRGQQEGILTLKLSYSVEDLVKQIELIKSRLGPTSQSRDPKSLLQELVLDDLEPWLLRILDQESEEKAIVAACESLAGLLRADMLQVKRLGAIHIGRLKSPMAIVITDREGDLLDQKAVKAQSSGVDQILEFMEQQSVHNIVLPTSSPAIELLAEIETKLSKKDVLVVKVRSAALSEARMPLTDPPMRLSSSLASALVLARRALDPLKEWSKVDPGSIGIAEYQNDLNVERLRAALSEVVELCRLERRQGKSVYMGTPVTRGTSAMKRLNPLVKSFADLRPGMTVNGLVSNISHFGVFVNIGLPQEALVHVSELSDEFVSNPNEVVQVGQQVQAFVLSIDTTRGRISLSMKKRRPETANHRRQQEFRAKTSAPKTKADALANLEKLFKK